MVMRFVLPWSRKSTTSMTTGMLLQELIAAGGGSKAGVVVNRHTAMQCVTAMRCARRISEDLAQIPFRVMRTQGRQRLPATEHPLYDLLARKPNDWQTSFEFREMLGLHLNFCGQAFVWKNYVGGELVELLPFTPGSVTVSRDGWDVRYKAQLLDGSQIDIPKSQMWHLRGASWDGVVALEPIRLMREALGLALATEAHGARLFGNGAQAGGILSTDSTLTPDQRKALREDWDARHSGPSNAYRTAILWGGLKYTTMSMGNDEAQYLETRRFQVEQICSAMGVLPIMVGHADKAQTYASAEQMFLAHVVYTMGPWYSRVEQSAEVNLLTDEERRQGYYTKFFPNALMRGAAQTRAQYYTSLFNLGALNPNEIREFEDMNPYDGGDTYRVPLNTASPVADGAAGDGTDPKPAPEAAQ